MMDIVRGKILKTEYLNIAKSYRHVGHVEMLGSNQPWENVTLSRSSSGDHKMLHYVEKLVVLAGTSIPSLTAHMRSALQEIMVTPGRRHSGGTIFHGSF